MTAGNKFPFASCWKGSMAHRQSDMSMVYTISYTVLKLLGENGVIHGFYIAA